MTSTLQQDRPSRGRPRHERHENLVEQVPAGVGPWDRAEIGDIVASLPALVTWRAGAEDDGPRQRAAQSVLEWLSAFPGHGWQARWDAAGVHDSGWIGQVIEVCAGQKSCRRNLLVPALGGLLLLRVMRPSYPFLRAYRANKLYRNVTEVIAPEVFARIRHSFRDAGFGVGHAEKGLNAIAKMVLHTGREPDELTAEDVLRFRAQDMHTWGSRSFTPHGLHAAWEMLHRAGIITGPPNLIEMLRRGQRPTAEIVDSYHVQCGPIRNVLVRYLDERRPSVDYGTFRSLVATLAGRFWADLEQHHPGITSLHLVADVSQAWKQRLSRLSPEHGGGTRNDYIENLLQVRAFYLDITQWALEDPSWAPWAVPCPIRRGDTVGIYKKRRAVVAKMHQRVRELLPHLDTLADTADRCRTEQAEVLAQASTTAVGDQFEHAGAVYERAARKSARAANGLESASPVLVREATHTELTNLSRCEDEAFWAWAVIETLRHTGVRSRNCSSSPNSRSCPTGSPTPAKWCRCCRSCRRSPTRNDYCWSVPNSRTCSLQSSAVCGRPTAAWCRWPAATTATSGPPGRHCRICSNAGTAGATKSSPTAPCRTC
jgi:hypothetical protein